jgi:hypothetical protein
MRAEQGCQHPGCDQTVTHVATAPFQWEDASSPSVLFVRLPPPCTSNRSRVVNRHPVGTEQYQAYDRERASRVDTPRATDNWCRLTPSGARVSSRDHGREATRKCSRQG